MNKVRHIIWKLSKGLFGIFLTNEDIPYTATEFRDRIRLSHYRRFIVLLVATFWILLAYILLLSIKFLTTPDTLYNVSSKTERVFISTYGNSKFPPWSIERGVHYESCSAEKVSVSGTLDIEKNAEIFVERIAHDSIWITLNSKTLEPVGTILLADDSRKTLSDCETFELQISDINSYTFPIDGNIEVGGEIKEMSSREAILYEGEITISDKGAVSNLYYQTEPYPLKPGDKFSILNPTTQSSGFIFISNDEPAMQVTFNGKGDFGVISRYKSEDIFLQNSIWTKLAHDESLVFLWIFLVAYFSFLKFIIRISIE